MPNRGSPRMSQPVHLPHLPRGMLAQDPQEETEPAVEEVTTGSAITGYSHKCLVFVSCRKSQLDGESIAIAQHREFNFISRSICANRND